MLITYTMTMYLYTGFTLIQSIQMKTTLLNILNDHATAVPFTRRETVVRERLLTAF